MNKAELIETVSEQTGLSKTQADEVLKSILATITGQLSKGNKITLVGFGTFERRKRKARVGVNPQNPTQKIKIPAKNAPAFSAGSELKAAVQTGKAPVLAQKKIAAKKAAVKKTTAKNATAKKATKAKAKR
ncbi:MAG: HU family DNA-binding protein [Cyanobacteria bacterium]|nr:HU family DNA-binding protein [Cyanobacteriota bacterium]MDA1021360.1 HU family DNA-binding protein [Cyanobacteriota bacterium]